MRRVNGSVLALTAVMLVTAAEARAQDASKSVAGGGISVSGWNGKVDANEASSGQTVNSAKFAAEGNGFHVTTGPAITYWKSGAPAKGDYTVRATFTEPKYMNLNSHPHPYGIVIGGNDMGTDNQSLFYCAAYGSGRFIARGFGPAPFQLNGRGEANDAVHKAAGQGEPVTQEIAVSVRGDKVDCSINGTVVGSYNKSDLVGAGKLKSTDGAYGIRFGHNTEAVVTNFSMTPAVHK
ncbi:hypothetical protein J421_1114 [Gemmatirosa kalamazoonensis]|uniref:3-keto-disaccharide hydrolase domain-containing protein n=1 Tax=Gemmatirosa kalamazoonensis TaxID=861299 RepID=W0RCX3_9BACT|nr:hypothetical protein [Gemmatirosa kalamazoonensis]AHG88651.1 hypothetical protein J421_1114 [Gemmatirosa kalamazoonensis]